MSRGSRFFGGVLAAALGATALGAAGLALAAEGGHHLKTHDWSFARPIGASFDQGAVQRGFQVYKEVCAACHAMDHLSYRNLGEKGGPWAVYGVKDPATSQWKITYPKAFAAKEEGEKGKHEAHKGAFVPPNENVFVRAIAEEYEITEIDPTTGDEITRKARPADRFVSPYTNPYQAAAVHGVAPPDLSVIAKARHGGADYIVGLLTGYVDPPAGLAAPADNLHYNTVYPGNWISMPPQLLPDRVTYSDGTPATPDQMARDVATFLQWAAEPKQIERQQLGFGVLAFLLVLTCLLYATYRQVWRGVKH